MWLLHHVSILKNGWIVESVTTIQLRNGHVCPILWLLQPVKVGKTNATALACFNFRLTSVGIVHFISEAGTDS